MISALNTEKIATILPTSKEHIRIKKQIKDKSKNAATMKVGS